MPTIGIISCNIELDAPHHVVFEKYVDQLADLYGWTPVLIPAFHLAARGSLAVHAARLVARLDGFLLPGSPSNVHPDAYCRAPDPQREQTFDRRRDQTSLTLIRQAAQAGKPVFGICRGLQEMNVALGGTLDWVPSLRQQPPHTSVDHTARKNVPFADKYLPTHTVELAPDGVIVSILRKRDVTIPEGGFSVNSLHRQCIGELGHGVQAEARAVDGVIEAISYESARQFCVGVQWHPEWNSSKDALNRALFEEFAHACSMSAQRASHPHEQAMDHVEAC